MKKNVVLLFICVILIMCGCGYDRYYGKRPFDYGEAKWVCEEPSAWFVIEPESEDFTHPKGEIVWNKQTFSVEYHFSSRIQRIESGIHCATAPFIMSGMPTDVSSSASARPCGPCGQM